MRRGKILNPSTEIKNNLYGWCQLPRNYKVTINNNKFIENLEGIFKTGHQDVDGDVLYMVPAVRGMLIPKHKHYGIASCANTKDVMFNKFDMADLSPLNVSKLYYNVVCLGNELRKLNNMSLQFIIDGIRHKDLIEEIDFDKEFVSDEYLDQRPVISVTYSGQGNCTDEIIRAIDKEINKFGGLSQYYKLHQIRGVNDPSILKSHLPNLKRCKEVDENGKVSYKMEFEHGLFNPIKKCNICDKWNHYSSLDRGLRQVHYSLAKYRKKHKVLKDKFETVKNTDDIKYHVPWRCGYCFSDLNLKVEITMEAREYIFKFIMENLFVLHGDIEQLLKLGYGDTYEDLSMDEKKSIKTDDQRTIREYFFHLQKKIIPVGHDFDKLMQANISKNIGGCFFRATSKYNGIKPELIAEISTFTELVKTMMNPNHVACIGDVLPSKNDDKYHQWYKNDHWFCSELATGCTSSGVCDHNNKFTVFGSIGALNMSLNLIMSIVKKQRQLQIIIPMRSSSNTLMDKTGVFDSADGTLNLFLDGDPVGFKMKADTYMTLHDYDLIVYDSELYLITETRRLSLTKLINVTGPYSRKSQLPMLAIDHTAKQSIRLFLPDVNCFMGNWTGMNFREQTFELNAPLFKYLCLRNLSGQVGHNTLRQYAVGFAIRRFVIHNKVIANPTIAYEQVDIHIILSRVCMMKLRGMFSASYAYSKFTKLLGPFRGLMGDVETAITATLIGLFAELLSTKFGITLDHVLNLFESSSLKSFITGICDTRLWDNLLLMAENVKFKDLKIINVDDNIYDTNLPNITICNHHGEKCDHVEALIFNRCKCCNIKTAMREFCKCCMPSPADNDKFFRYDKWVDSDEVKTGKETTGLKLEISNNAVNEYNAYKNYMSKSENEPLLKKMISTIKESEVKQKYQDKNEKEENELDKLKPKKVEVDKEGDRETWVDLFTNKARKAIAKTKKLLTPVVDKAVDDMRDITEVDILTKLGYEFVTHVEEPVKYEDIVNSEPSVNYYLPHCLEGVTFLSRDTFEIIEVINLPNSGSLTCGYDAYNYVSDVPIEMKSFEKLCGGQPPFSQINLMDYAQVTRENLILVCLNTIILCKYDLDDDYFKCIKFDEPENVNEIGHFSPTIIRRKLRGSQYFAYKYPANSNDRTDILRTRFRGAITCHNVGDITAKENLICELTFYYSMNQLPANNIVADVEITSINDKMYLTNNKETGIHSIESDRIHVMIPDHIKPLADKISYALKGELKMTDLPEFRHTAKELPNNTEEAIVEQMNEILRSIVRIRAMITDRDTANIRQVIKGYVEPWFKYSKFDTHKSFITKLKKFDLVILKMDNKKELVAVVGFDRGKLILDKQLLFKKEVTITELKDSYGSKIRELIGYCQPCLKMEVIKEIIYNAKFTTGPAGYGKSTKIGELAKPGDVCVAMTSSSVKSLESKVQPGVVVLSLEKALYTHRKCNETLYVDEATMVDWLAIAMMVQAKTSLVMFGAENQIGKIDMSRTPGVRHVINIMDLVSDKNITRERVTYRIGENMRTLLEDVEPGLISKATHNTTYTISTFDDAEFDNIDIAIARCKPDVVITPYNYNKIRIEERITKNPVLVVTTHAFQGVEVNRAMLVLRANALGRWELNGMPEYLNSGLTRAKNHTDIVIYGYPNPNVKSLRDIMTMVAGLRLWNANQIEAETDDTPDAIDFNDELTEKTKIKNIHKLTVQEVNLLNDMNLAMEGASIHYEKIENGTIATATKFLITIGKVINVNGEVTIEANNTIKRKIEENMDRTLTLPDAVSYNKIKNMEDNNVMLSSRSAAKIKELAWIVDKTVDGMLRVRLDGSIICITKTKGCPLFAGLTFKSGAETLIIHDGWKGIMRRNISIMRNRIYDSLSPVVKWLDLKIPNVIIREEANIDWLKHLTGDLANAYWQLKERLTNVHIWMLNMFAMDDVPKCYMNNMRNVALYNKLARPLNIELTDEHQSVIPHQTLILEQSKLMGYKKSYTLVDMKGAIMEVSIKSNVKTWSAFVIEALQDIRKNGEEIRGISVTDLNIDGLRIPLSKHFAIGTEIKSLVYTEINKINRLIDSGVHDLIRIDKQANELYNHIIKARFPKLTIATSNYEQISSHVESILENIMLNTIGRLSKHSKEVAVYGGPIPLTVCQQGKYYIKIRVPKLEEPTRYMYDIQLPSVLSKLSHFNLMKDEENKIDPLWNEESCHRLMLGCDIYCIEEELLIELMDKSEYLYGWTPILNNNGEYFQTNSEHNLIGYKHGVHSKQIRNKLIEDVELGKPIMVNLDKNEYVEANIIMEFMDHRLVKLRRRVIPDCRYVDRYIGTRQDISGEVTVRVPWIDFDLMRIIGEKKIVCIKELKVNRMTLRNILMRLMTGDDSESSVLAYTRTLESTQLITDKGIQDMNTGNLLVALNTSWYALYLHNDYITKFKMLINLVTSCEGNALATGLVESLLPGLLQMLGKVSEKMSEIAYEVIKNLNSNVNLVNSMMDVIKENEKMNWSMDYTERRKNRYYFQQDSEEVLKGWINSINEGETHEPEDDEDKCPSYDDKDSIEGLSENSSQSYKFDLKEFEEDIKMEDEDESVYLSDINERLSEENNPEDEMVQEQKERIDDEWVKSSGEEEIFEESLEIQEETEVIEELIGIEESEPKPLRRRLRKKFEEPEERGIIDDSIEEEVSAQEESASKLIEEEVGLQEESAPKPLRRRLRKKFVESDEETSEKDSIKEGLLSDEEDKEPRVKEEEEAVESILMRNINKENLAPRVDEELWRKVIDQDRPVKAPLLLEQNMKCIPKIFWSYWHDHEIPDMVMLMINTWQMTNPNYRIIIVTEKTIKNMVSRTKYEELERQTTQFKSDWIRLYILKVFGGIWIDTSTILTDSIDEFVTHTIEGESGVFQISLCKRNNMNKTFESWFIICTKHNDLIKEWYEVTDAMMGRSESNGDGALEWLSVKYPDIYPKIIGSIVPNLQKYLRVYLTEKIAIALTNGIEPSCITEDEGEVSLFHKLPIGDWVRLWKIFGDEEMSKHKVTIPVVKLIGKMRELLMLDYKYREPVKNSYLEFCKRAPALRYNIFNCSKLTITDKVVKHKEESIVISCHKNTKVLLLCSGTRGDIMQFLPIYDLCWGLGVQATIITNSDHSALIGDRQWHKLTSSSTTLMALASSVIEGKDVTKTTEAVTIINLVKKETENIINNYKDMKPLVIMNNVYPNKKNIMKLLNTKTIMMSTFPEEWVVTKPSSVTEDSINAKLIRLIYSCMEGATYEPMVIGKMLTSYEWMTREEHYQRVGPLTLYESGKREMNLIITGDNVCVITFGSSDILLESKSICQLISRVITKGYKVIYNDINNRNVPQSELNQLAYNYRGKIILVKELNWVELMDKIKLTICHGGYGTITEVLHSKSKLIIHPMIIDQHFWADKLQSYGLAVTLNKIDDEIAIENCLMLAGKTDLALKNLDRMLDVNLIELIKLIKTNTQCELDRINPGDSLSMIWDDDMNERVDNEIIKDIKGIKRLKMVKTELIINPGVINYCVKESILEALNENGKIKFLTSNNLGVTNLRDKGVHKGNLINGVLCLGCNLCLVDDLGDALIINIYDAPVITLKVDSQRSVWHCSLVNIRHYEDIEDLTFDALCQPLIDDIVKDIHNEWLSKYTVMELVSPEVLMSHMPKKRRLNIHYRIVNDNLNQLGARSDPNVLYLTLYKYRYMFITDCLTSDRDLSLGAVTASEGWRLVNWCIRGGRMVIFSYDNLPENVVFVNYHVKYEAPVRPSTTIIGKAKMYSLNKATVRHNEVNMLAPRSSAIVQGTMKGHTLIVSDYDNRSHHMSDERSLMSEAKKLVIHSDKPISLSLLNKSYDNSINRMILRSGFVMYVTEIGDERRTRIICRKFKIETVETKNVVMQNKLEGVAVDYMLKFFDTYSNKCKAYDNIDDDLLQLRDWDELFERLNNSLVLTSNDKEKLNEIARKRGKKITIACLTSVGLYGTKNSNIEEISCNEVILHSYGILVTFQSMGGSQQEQEQQWWKILSKKGESVPGDWWALRKQKQSEGKCPDLSDVIAYNTMTIHEPDQNYVENEVTAWDETSLQIYIAPYSTPYTGSAIEPLYDLPDLPSMQLWDDTDLTNWVTMYAPVNACEIKSRELPGKIIEVEKIVMSKWPIKSRAVLTKVCYEEGRSIVGRMKSVVFIRTMIPNTYKTVIELCETYFKTDWRYHITEYRNNRLIIDALDVQEWINENKDTDNIIREMLETLSGEIITKPINDVNVHLKVESLLKSNPITVSQEQQARIIVWQRKSICAIYSKLFVKVKNRLKDVLNEKILYTDGLRPDEISARIRLCNNVKGFFENDLTKQDRQTDKPIIDVEMAMYDILGVHTDVIRSWREMHETWRFKSKNYWGQGESMRLTGQATTAIGNCLTNMQVHQSFVKKNFYNLKLALFLGDDMCMLFDATPNIKSLRKDIATKFNMQSKDNWCNNGATFCSMVLCKLPNDRAELAADVVRLKHRYEVTNGAHESTAENLLMRKASYLMMLGDIPGVKEVVSNLNLPVKPIVWYGYDTMLQAVADKYDMTTVQVEGYYHNLLDMMRKDYKRSIKYRLFGNQ
ncbi:putative polyprotein [Yerba mate endornavirus]|uniref:Putative polyprotein n=1 Tax=Yerba mate endornavirus TaxID=1514896 RepID=A0A068FKS3_9VIRU|nr:putative polyprotein [Yerba mate alphaendornavirus]AID67139.1 putative polyprotein [Yerba mate alphaendornavirus]